MNLPFAAPFGRQPFLKEGFVIVLVMLGAWPLLGQDLGIGKASDRARAADSVLTLAAPMPAATPLPATAEQGVAKLPGDAEYGEQVILSRRANWEPWSLSTDEEYDFTDNAALAAKDARGDSYLRSGIEAHYANRISGNWFINAGLDGHAYLYDRYDALDFLLVKAEASLMYQVPWLADTFVSAGYAGYWISDSNLTAEAFNDQALTAGAQKIWKIARGMQVVAGVNVEYSLAAAPAGPQRDEYSSYLGYRLRLTEKLGVGASCRVAWYDYPAFDRHDWNEVAVVDASYTFTEWAKLTLSASAAWNRSNISFYNYNNVVGGLGLALTLAF